MAGRRSPFAGTPARWLSGVLKSGTLIRIDRGGVPADSYGNPRVEEVPLTSAWVDEAWPPGPYTISGGQPSTLSSD